MIAAIRRSLSFLSRKEKRVYFTLVICRALAGILDVVGIALIGLLTGLAATSLDAGKPLVVFGFTLPTVTEQTLLWLVLAVLVVFAAKAVIAISLGWGLSTFLARIDAEKSSEITRYLFTGNLARVQTLDKGEIAWTVMGSTSNAFAGLLANLSTFISEGLLLVLVAATFTLVDPIAAICVFVYFGVLIVVIQVVISRLLQKAGIDASEGNMESLLVVDDFLGAFREVTVFNKQDFYVNKFTGARSRVSFSGGMLNFLGGMPRYIVETALMLGVVIFVGYQFLTGQLASGLVTVGVFLTGGVRIMAALLPLQNAAAVAKNQVEQSAMAHRLLKEAGDFAAAQSTPARTDTAAREGHGDGLAPPSRLTTALNVRVDDVTYAYPGATDPALRNVTLNVESGQHVAIIGPSGAGKTTIVDMLLGLLAPSSGDVTISGMAPSSLTSSHPGLVSYVPQNPGLVTGTIAENIALGIESDKIDFARVDAAVSAAFLEDFISGLPDGVHTSVGKQGDALSGGQVQRLGLARALYEQPRLIILDEATSALDATSEAFIAQSLRNLGKDVTVIVIAHRLSTVQHSDVVYVVEDGAITASGTFSKLRKTVPMVAEYVKLMSFDEN
ncbi:MAG: ABC transporter ATP-binding protein [Microbacteriaceae bacterium]|nr:ABC transporter ATP-binding protein [Microbacteriaceae bacterium]